MTIELTYIYSWKGHEYVAQISGADIAVIEAQADKLLADFQARAGKDFNLSASEAGSVSYELDDLLGDDDL